MMPDVAPLNRFTGHRGIDFVPPRGNRDRDRRQRQRESTGFLTTRNEKRYGWPAAVDHEREAGRIEMKAFQCRHRGFGARISGAPNRVDGGREQLTSLAANAERGGIANEIPKTDGTTCMQIDDKASHVV